MTEIIAEAGRITRLGSEISSKITSGLQPDYAKKAGLKPMKFVASGQMAGAERGRSDHRPVQPL